MGVKKFKYLYSSSKEILVAACPPDDLAITFRQSENDWVMASRGYNIISLSSVYDGTDFDSITPEKAKNIYKNINPEKYYLQIKKKNLKLFKTIKTQKKCSGYNGGSKSKDFESFDLKIIDQTKKPSGGEIITISGGDERHSQPYGEIITSVYECPCGKGKIVLTEEKIPGNYDFYTNFDCIECNKKYEILWGKGVLPGHSPMIKRKYI